MILYTKSYCPYCVEAKDYLDARKIAYEEREVITNADALEKKKKKSGQDKVPTLEWHGKILADFGVDELEKFLEENNISG